MRRPTDAADTASRFRAPEWTTYNLRHEARDSLRNKISSRTSLAHRAQVCECGSVVECLTRTLRGQVRSPLGVGVHFFFSFTFLVAENIVTKKYRSICGRSKGRAPPSPSSSHKKIWPPPKVTRAFSTPPPFQSHKHTHTDAHTLICDTTRTCAASDNILPKPKL